MFSIIKTAKVAARTPPGGPFIRPASPIFVAVDEVEVEVGDAVGGDVIKLFSLPLAVEEAPKFVVTVVSPVSVAPGGV